MKTKAISSWLTGLVSAGRMDPVNAQLKATKMLFTPTISLSLGIFFVSFML